MKEDINVIMIPHNHEYIHELKKSLQKKKVNVYLMKPFHYSTPMNFLKFIWLRSKGYKIIHIHWVYIFPFTILMKFSILFAKLLGFKIVWTVHNVLPHNYKQKDIGKTRWFFNNVDYKLINYKSNINKIKSDLKINTGKKYKIIYHPIFNSYPNTISKEDARKKLNLPMDKKILLCFGMIRSYKGMDLFAECFKYLNNDYIGLIVGESRNKELLKKLEDYQESLDNLKIIPKRIENEKVQLYFNACDVVVLPYYEITTSGVVLLAYSFGKPVITTCVGGLPEVVINKKTGILIEPNNLKVLLESIKRIFNMDYQKMGENGKKLANERFTWDILADKTISAYKNVVNDQ